MPNTWPKVWLAIVLLVGVASTLPLGGDSGSTDAAESDEQLLEQLDGAAPLELVDQTEKVALVESEEVLHRDEEALNSSSGSSDEQTEAKRDKIYASLDQIRRKRFIEFKKVDDELRRARRNPIEDPDPVSTHNHNEPGDHPDQVAHEHLGDKHVLRLRRGSDKDESGSSEEKGEKKNKDESGSSEKKGEKKSKEQDSSEEQKKDEHEQARRRRAAESNASGSSEEPSDKKEKSHNSSEEQNKGESGQARSRRAAAANVRGSSEEVDEKKEKPQDSSEEQKKDEPEQAKSRRAVPDHARGSSEERDDKKSARPKRVPDQDSSSSSEENAEKKNKSNSADSSEEQQKPQQLQPETEAETETPARRRRSVEVQDEPDTQTDEEMLKAIGEPGHAADDEEKMKTSIEDYAQGCEVMEVNSKEANEATYME
ncbi:cylicin-2 [Scaptodrosophila lebanonensis]|uniref:Cylicin-2 n=1 Tax=Drosophila lebanonensis TaxID=7225 RepID=A0A6J2T0U8_DROLE|nr:cylicin-2 [Scaptodrosophila lebanonensis]